MKKIMNHGNHTSTSSRKECRSDLSPRRAALVMVPHLAAQGITSLLKSYAENDIDYKLITYNEVPTEQHIKDLASGADAVLYISPGSRSPRTVGSSPTITLRTGRQIPLGIVPFKSLPQLRKFASAAVSVHRRDKSISSLALLSQRHPRYVRVSKRIEEILSTANASFPMVTWTADIVVREEMLRGLNSELAMALYLGHGRPIGWVGYYGTRAHHFYKNSRPLGALLSLCCHTASRRRTGLSFAEDLVLRGVTASALAAVQATKYIDNTRWAVHLTEQMQKRPTSIGELIVSSMPIHTQALTSYRLIGDPFAPILAPSGGIKRAQQIKTYR